MGLDSPFGCPCIPRSRSPHDINSHEGRGKGVNGQAAARRQNHGGARSFQRLYGALQVAPRCASSLKTSRMLATTGLTSGPDMPSQPFGYLRTPLTCVDVKAFNANKHHNCPHTALYRLYSPHSYDKATSPNSPALPIAPRTSGS